MVGADEGASGAGGVGEAELRQVSWGQSTTYGSRYGPERKPGKPYPEEALLRQEHSVRTGSPAADNRKHTHPPSPVCQCCSAGKTQHTAAGTAAVLSPVQPRGAHACGLRDGRPGEQAENGHGRDAGEPHGGASRAGRFSKSAGFGGQTYRQERGKSM